VSDHRGSRLDAIFRPRSVGVVGVSCSAGKVGNTVCANVLAGGYDGTVYAIGSARDVAGALCVPRLADLPEPPELLFLAVPAEATVGLATEAAQIGVKAVIVGAAGFAESSEAGAVLEEQLARLAHETGLMIVGPNCNGIYSASASLSLGFNAGHARRWPRGRIALLSHSGALFDALARAIARFGGGLSLFVSAGNEVDRDVLDYLEYAIEDPHAKVIALLIDAVPDPRRFRALAAAAAAAGKPIAALKLGASAKGARAATAHSSRLAGDHVAHRALFDACGVLHASTLEGLAAAAAMLDQVGRVGGGLAAISTSGAGASLVADLCHAFDVPLADYGNITLATLSARRKFSTLANPIDLGFFGSLDGFDSVMETIVADEGVGAFLAFVHSIGPRFNRLSEAWQHSVGVTGKPHIVLAPGGLEPDELAAYRAAGVQVFTESEPCFTALRALFTQPAQITLQRDPPLERGTCAKPAVIIEEAASLAALAGFGVRTVAVIVCDDAEAAVRAAADLGYPVAVKGVVDGVAHKSEAGLVALDISGEERLREACSTIGAPVLVEPMLRAELEAIIGFSNDPSAGPVLVFGLGGVHAETLAQTSTVSLPAGRDALARALDDSIVGRVLAGPRWRHDRARAEFLDALVAVEAFALADAAIEAVDLNPVMLGAHGAVAVDALIMRRSTTERVGDPSS